MIAAVIPGLLMLATFGLERLESSLCSGANSDRIDDLVAQCSPKADRPSHSPVVHAHLTFAGLSPLDDEPRLPTRVCGPETENPQFQPTRHANPV
jgi:hypothetical protein